MIPVQKHTRSAVRSLAAAALACNGAAQPGRKARLAQAALDLYELATEYDTDFYISGPDYERVREAAKGGRAGQGWLYLPPADEGIAAARAEAADQEQAAGEAEVAEFARSHNLVVWPTGGGCEALAFEWTDGSYVLFTDKDDPAVPASLGTPVQLGWFNSKGDQILQVQFPTLGQAYEAIDDGWSAINRLILPTVGLKRQDEWGNDPITWTAAKLRAETKGLL